MIISNQTLSLLLILPQQRKCVQQQQKPRLFLCFLAFLIFFENLKRHRNPKLRLFCHQRSSYSSFRFGDIVILIFCDEQSRAEEVRRNSSWKVTCWRYLNNSLPKVLRVCLLEHYKNFSVDCNPVSVQCVQCGRLLSKT